MMLAEEDSAYASARDLPACAMHEEFPLVRRRWVRRPGVWALAMLAVLLAALGWGGWRAYDYRAAVGEAEAAGFAFFESRTPFDAIRADWHDAFRLDTWTEHERKLFLPEGTDLAPLRPLLLRLDPTFLRAEHCRNVAALRGVTGLRVLDLFASDVKDLAPLAGLAQLQGLVLGGCTGVTDLAPLAGLAQLQELELKGCTGVTDLAPLVGLAQLQELELNGCTGVKDLAPLAGLTQLQNLNLTGCTGAVDLAPLAGLAQLQRVELKGCTGVKDLAPLAGLAQLEWLTLIRCTGLSAEAVAAFKMGHPQVAVYDQ